MKKTLSIVLILTLLGVFFCSNVSAATSNVLTQQTKQRVVSNVTGTVTGTQFYIDADSYLPGGYTTAIYVVLQMYNGNSVEKLVNNIAFALSFTNQIEVYDVENISPDLTVSNWDTGWYYCVPSTDLAYGNGVVIPPNESVYLVCKVYVGAYFNSQTNTFTSDPLVSVNVSNFTVSNNTTSVYPYGDPVDFSPIMPYVTGIEGDTSSMVTTLNDMELLLTDIKNQIAFTGTISSTMHRNYRESTVTASSVPAQTEMGVQIVQLSSFTAEDTVAIAGGNEYHKSLYVTPVQITLYVRNHNEYALNGSTIVINNLFYKTGEPSIVVQAPDNECYNTPYVYRNGDYWSVYIDPKIGISTQKYIPSGNSIFTFMVYVIHDTIENSYYYSTPTITFNYSVSTYQMKSSSPIPYLSDLNINVAAILLAMQSQYSNQIDSDSASLKQQSENAHQQEQAFFNQNSQAIANSGLGNYQFSTDQGNGISVATDLFNRLWNSVGAWNSVYVFSLTLSIALTIIRYTTNSIRRRGRAGKGEGQ